MRFRRRPPTHSEDDPEPSRRRAWGAPGTPPQRTPATKPPSAPAPSKSAASSAAPKATPAKAATPARPAAPAEKSRAAAGAPKATFTPPARSETPASRPAAPASPPTPSGSFQSPVRARAHLARPALISRAERVLFAVLLLSVLGMSIFLVRYREHVDAHFQSRVLAVPLSEAAASTTPAPLMLYLANDDTGSLVERPLAFPLPEDPNTRARVVLAKLLSEYAAPGSPHPLPPAPAGVEGVDEVYLAPVPGGAPHSLLAVVDLTPTFIHNHPSGIEPETLTLLSMIATLHANLPAVSEVRFLVDGEPRATLAGHADMSHTYLAGAAQIAPGEAFQSRRP